MTQNDVTLTMIQQSAEWLEFRKNRIGASDAPIIMGVSPWCTPIELWKRKLGLIPERPKTEAMQRGLDLEPKARFSFLKKTNIPMSPSIIIHPLFDWMMASFDGICDVSHRVLEIKCPGQTDHETAKSGHIPNKYYPQLQHQLEVSGYDQGYYMSYVSDDDNVIVEFERDSDYIRDMIEKERKFYDCMQNFIPPSLTEKDYVCKSDSHWNDIVSEYVQLKGTMTAYSEREAELREQLIQMAGGQNCKGSGIKLQKITRKGNVDYSKIPQLVDVDLEKYRSDPVECWKITQD